ncbi:MAG: hypothetical protein WBD48_07865 [Pseudolabrys sp.]
MLRRPMLLVLAALTAVAIGAPLARAAAVFPPAIRIGLEPPSGMIVSTHFAGFEDADRKATIKILDLPASMYEELEKTVFATTNAGAGVTVDKRESFPFQDGIGFLITFHVEKDGVLTRKWVMLANSMSPSVPNLTMLIEVEVPAAASTTYTDAVIRAALTSVTFRPPPIDEQMRMLPFKLDTLAGFRVMQVMPNGVAILTDGPSSDLTQQPYMIVAVGPSAPVEPGERETFSRRLLASAPLRDLRVTSSESMRINNLPGYEIRAQALGMRNDPLSLVQWVRFGSGGFLRVVGVGRRDDWDKLFPRFREVRDGVGQR